jgi:hypothetical protein
MKVKLNLNNWMTMEEISNMTQKVFDEIENESAELLYVNEKTNRAALKSCRGKEYSRHMSYVTAL